jgi:AcrR family transcriptional regulator
MIPIALSGETEERVRYRRAIRAAEGLFKKVGFRAVTMEAVAREAALSKVTLYSYFKNKDVMFVAVSTRMAEILLRAFSERVSGVGSLDDRLSTALIAKHKLAFELVRGSPHAADLFSHKEQLAGEVFAQADAAMLGLISNDLGKEELLVSSAPQLARAIFYGSSELAARASNLGELEAELDAFVRTLLAGGRTLARQHRRKTAPKSTRGKIHDG